MIYAGSGLVHLQQSFISVFDLSDVDCFSGFAELEKRFACKRVFFIDNEVLDE